MNFFQATILLGLISLGIALKACQIPSQWQAKMYERDDKKYFRSRVDYSYDSLNRKTRKIGLENYGNYQDYVDVLRLFNEKIEYRYSFTSKTCVKSLINSDFKDFGIPQGASYYADLYVGSSDFADSNLLTSSWGAEITTSQGEKFDFLDDWPAQSFKTGIRLIEKQHKKGKYYAVVKGVRKRLTYNEIFDELRKEYNVTDERRIINKNNETTILVKIETEDETHHINILRHVVKCANCGSNDHLGGIKKCSVYKKYVSKVANKNSTYADIVKKQAEDSGREPRKKLPQTIETKPVIQCIKEIIETLKNEENVLEIVVKSLGTVISRKIVRLIKNNKRENNRQINMNENNGIEENMTEQINERNNRINNAEEINRIQNV
ncbi:unnamed protein product [Brachionus calyciflorus]|uniref:Uncharacterized protein n=1 Tax=Brachionus calyciflorus TaxID=104777 RepID=A0A814GXM1_9BILA|nr:unnamed protein product [Brachionus calyciflorus]